MALRIVNFGTSKGGLATVGYTIYGVDGATVAARSTTGVTEIGTSTGVYAANISMPDYDAVVLWDTGEGTPRYATEDYQFAITDIRNQVGRVNQIYNSIRNQGEFFSAFMDKLGLLQKNEGLVKINERLDDIASQKREPLPMTDIEEAFKKAAGSLRIEPQVTVNPTPVTVTPPAVKMNKLPNYSGNFASLTGMLKDLQKTLQSKGADTVKLDKTLGAMQAVFVKLDEVLNKIHSLKEEAKDKSDKKEILEEIKGLNSLLKSLATTKQNMDILMSLGHKR